MAAITTQQCFSDDWRRSNPDLVVYLPAEPPYTPESVDHTMIDYTPGGDLLAVWTWATEVKGEDQSMAFARSTDGGVNWTAPSIIDGVGPGPGQKSQWGFPVVSRAGRIYVFYNKSLGRNRGVYIRCKYSDDDGYTWTDGGVDLEYRRTQFDHPDPSIPPSCIIWQKSTRDSKGRQIVPLSHGTDPYVKPELDAAYMGGSHIAMLGEMRAEFLRFDNIDEGPDPKDLELTWLPDDANELIPDGRLFTEMRTVNGDIWYTVSDDHGHTWRPTEVLRYRDGGDPVLNPIAPSPMFSLEDGRYILFLQNHDGFGYGGRGPLDLNSRRPQFLAVGEYRPDAHQPVWFSEPLFLFDTQKVGVFPLNFMWLSMYASFTEREGRRVFWYTDRKIFVLGRYITDEMMAGLTVPS